MPNRRRNDRNSPHPKRGPHPFRGREKARAPAGLEWLWGRHAVEAAIANPLRPGFQRLLLAPGKSLARLPAETRPEVLDNREISRLLPPGAVHQGYALLAQPLEPTDLEEIATPAAGVILVLDQVTDPQNVGTILRSAAAFGARAVIMQDRHAPPLGGVLAKAAAGAVDQIPIAREVNLSRALDALARLGWRSVGLDGGAQTRLDEVLDGSATVLVLGSEGEGLRRLVTEHCDAVARIAAAQGFESLNVASAAAVALYEAAKLASRATNRST
jgi:23S rRNA (guanosine2251-2'-O)-methyltransferase